MVTATRASLTPLCLSISLLTSALAHAQLEEVVVTAQKRSENLQDVPLAVTSLSRQQIEESNLPDIAGLTALAPSLNFTLGSSDRNSSLRIRGLGTDSFNVGIEPSVSIVIDGVVQTRPSAAFARLTDVERVEGPFFRLRGMFQAPISASCRYDGAGRSSGRSTCSDGGYDPRPGPKG